MTKTIAKWLNIHGDEIRLFLWAAVLMFLIRSSAAYFNNYAETAFLKRFGVEYLPVVYMLNSIVTFIIMGVLTGLLAAMPGARLLGRLLFFAGLSVAGLRMMIPLGIDLLYPLLFMLKAQYEILLGLLFWNMANDLFNTRQSKRLFPLLSAGGVIGDILGSFSTPFLSQLLTLDNLLFIYLGTTAAGGLIVQSMGRRFPTLLVSERKSGKTRKKRASIVSELRRVIPMLKESNLVKVMVLLTLIPNLVIPILNYQFNFAVNDQFATEGGLIAFFSYFRGAMNVVSLILLLFVGRVYGRWGLPVALMFHPINYALVFVAFLLRFDMFSAMYARMSTNIFRTVFNKPASDVVMGLFPTAYRAVIRPFLRGTVVRIGLLISSSIILLTGNYFHPRYLSIVAIPLALVWIGTVFYFKRSYARILLDLISRNMIDLKAMEATNIGEIFRDKKTRRELTALFESVPENDCVWYAELMQTLGEPELDRLLVKRLNTVSDGTRIGLLNLLSPEAAAVSLPALDRLSREAPPAVLEAVVRALNRMEGEAGRELQLRILDETEDLRVRAYALAGLFETDPDGFEQRIVSWLESETLEMRLAGVVAAGESGSKRFIDRLLPLLNEMAAERLLNDTFHSLYQLQARELNEVILPFLSHPSPSVRFSGLKALSVSDDESLARVIRLLGDPDDRVRGLAENKIEAGPHVNDRLLIESLSIPRRRIREGIFDLLASMNIKDLEVFRYVRSRIEVAYGYLAEEEAIQRYPASQRRDLLLEHLGHEKRLLLENALRVLAAQDRSGQMRIVWRGLFSDDARQRANSQEALDDLTDAALTRILLPLFEGQPPADTLAVGRRHFKLPDPGSTFADILHHFLAKPDPVTQSLALFWGEEASPGDIDRQRVKELSLSDIACIRGIACRLDEDVDDGDAVDRQAKGNLMKSQITVPEMILHLKKIEIFEDLSISELAAIASVTEEVTSAAGELVINEGDTGDTMYLIIAGEVSVIKGLASGAPLELDRIATGDYFGEMALFEDVVRSASIRTEADTRLLVLRKQEFEEIVKEYPQIALHICKVLSSRLRRLHDKIRT
jgi:hypothetical protein